MSATTQLVMRLRAAGMSQTEISKRTGIPQPRISRWAGGAVPAGADDALRLRALVDELDKATAAPATEATTPQEA